MPAKQPVTMGDIARLANVSKPTVSRALSNSPLINKKTKEHVLAVAREHGYAVNRNAQKLRQKRTNTIAVSLDYMPQNGHHISDPFIFELLTGVSEALGKENQELLLCSPNHNNAASFQHMLSSRGADGFIFLGQGHRESMLDDIAQLDAPMVVWGAGTNSTPYCVVGSDNFLGGLLAGRYFLKKKRRRFLFIGDTSFKELHWRHAGLTQAIKESSQPISIESLLLGDFSYQTTLDKSAYYLESSQYHPDAIFAYSDTAAMAFICALKEKGINVPQAASVVGYNDIASAAYFSPSITTVGQDPNQASKLLVNNLMQMIAGEQPLSSTIKTRLIIRET